VQAIQSAGDFKLHHVDVLHDDGVRDAVKRYNDWPTVPQVFAGGEFVGGCDIIEQMHSSGQLGQALRVEMGESANGMSTEAA
jgi:monothiol glutaredoxin